MPTVFNNPSLIAEGWYWVIPSKEVKKKQIKAVTVVCKDLAVFRTEAGKVRIFDAYCPHMGSHLAEGKVEGENLRCFFHQWKYNSEGQCIEIPCFQSKIPDSAKVKTWKTYEKYNLIWLWLGEAEPPEKFPEIPELEGQEVFVILGKPLFHQCHPHIVMINAIDEQHFHSVHNLPGSSLLMKSKIINQNNIHFFNTGKVPGDLSLFYKIIAKFYGEVWTYALSYWSGCLGTVTFGPDFLHMYLMFALRPTLDGKTEGQTIYITKKRKGFLGYLINLLIVSITAIGDQYFGVGDTKIFQSIKFNFQTPLPQDKTVSDYIAHLNGQNYLQINASK